MTNEKPATDDADWQAAAYEQFLRDDSDDDLLYEDAWAEEVERRHAEIESGEVALLDGAETLEKLKFEFQ